jgi:hypothetical protein
VPVRLVPTKPLSKSFGRLALANRAGGHLYCFLKQPHKETCKYGYMAPLALPTALQRTCCSYSVTTGTATDVDLALGAGSLRVRWGMPRPEM